MKLFLSKMGFKDISKTTSSKLGKDSFIESQTIRPLSYIQLYKNPEPNLVSFRMHACNVLKQLQKSIFILRNKKCIVYLMETDK